jgi:hypothetical protein
MRCIAVTDCGESRIDRVRSRKDSPLALNVQRVAQKKREVSVSGTCQRTFMTTPLRSRYGLTSLIDRDSWKSSPLTCNGTK